MRKHSCSHIKEVDTWLYKNNNKIIHSFQDIILFFPYCNILDQSKLQHGWTLVCFYLLLKVIMKIKVLIRAIIYKNQKYITLFSVNWAKLIRE
jgi:hypothetical protein